jgi:hypothetical protein
MWLSPADTEGESGIVAVHLMTPSAVERVKYNSFRKYFLHVKTKSEILDYF